MTRLILSIYDFLKNHSSIAWLGFIISTLGLVALVMRLNYQEDISAFLPLDEKNKTAMSVYQDVSGANNIFAIINAKDSNGCDPQILAEGVEVLCDKITETDTTGYITNVVKQIDLESISDVRDFVYSNLPLFLTDKDYSRIDSLLSDTTYIAKKLEDDKQMLLFPSSSMMTENLARDPLSLFSPVLTRMQNAGVGIKFENFDGYILTPDGLRAIAILTSANGANESENNAKLIDLLDEAKKNAEETVDGIDVHFVGGPSIAVTNASQIKHDSFVAVAIAGILILILLIYVFRNLRNILLIVVSVGWGWLFAMGAISLVYNSVSIIVIGIASVILGIAVNYPLHLIDHLKDAKNRKSALKEIISPLIVGNVTTVGAFLCLVPLNAPALHDLGLFSSLLLVGTILFVLVFLPHAVKSSPVQHAEVTDLISRISDFSPVHNKWLVWIIAALTIVFGVFAMRTEFDSDMRNINYMTPEQRADMDYFTSLVSQNANSEKLYVVSSGKDWEEALTLNEVIGREISQLESEGQIVRSNAVSSFITSNRRQNERLEKWNVFIADHKDRLLEDLASESRIVGFNMEAFLPFTEILNASYSALDADAFQPLTQSLFKGNFSTDPTTSRHSLVEVLEVDPVEIDGIKDKLSKVKEFGGQVFDVKSMNGSIANTLSDDFNYIGIACGCIVFFFLWISLGSIELAIVSFLPMAVSWIWILGVMGILGLKFNIVNVILATFIFGQGDDYTIFMTEGLSYEFAYQKKVLKSYKNSIIVSALIMFIGIGTLVFAKHPALRSLGEVTVVGMLSVVLMAYLLPPLVFNWLVYKNGRRRYRPITLKKMLSTGFCALVFLSQLMVGYVMGFFMFVLTKPTPEKKLLLHRFTCSVFRWDVKRMPGMKFRLINKGKVDFEKPVVIISNHQSMLDPFYLMTLSPKLIVVANDHVGYNKVTGRMFRWLNFITVGQGIDAMLEKLQPLVAQGYSIAIFPEGERPTNVSNHVKRFHKGAFQFAETLGLDVVPVYLHGLVQAMPKGCALSNGYEIVMEIGNKISVEKLDAMGPDIKTTTQHMRRLYQTHFTELCRAQDTVANLAPVVFDKYLYKGSEIERNARKNLRKISLYSRKIENLEIKSSLLVVDDKGQGELALILALMYPDRFVFAYLPYEDSRDILKGCIMDFIPNIQVVDKEAISSLSISDYRVFSPSTDCLVKTTDSISLIEL